MIICIGREFGSGGHEIGKIIAEKLGMELYDRDLIDKAAEKIVAMPKEVLEKAEKKKHNPYNGVMGSELTIYMVLSIVEFIFVGLYIVLLL